MDFQPSREAAELCERLHAFMNERVIPAEATYAEQMAAANTPHHHPPVMEELKAEARKRGLWNLFLPYRTQWTEGLSNVDFAPLAELMGRSPIAPEACNCSAPDTGTMEMLALFGTTEQQAQWLQPLLAGEIRSCIAMTEPSVASSDATNVRTRIERRGDQYVLNGRKWFITGAGHPRCRVSVVMGRTDPDAPPHRQQSQVLVPMDTPGVTVLRDLRVFGYTDPEGHCEITYDDVHVPVANLVGEQGAGFAMAQVWLGPGRLHHAMRTIGLAERALGLMCERLRSRVAFGSPIADKGAWEERIARSRIAVDQARLHTLYAAWVMDTRGNKAASAEIAAVKASVPSMALSIVDYAIQAHGAAGVSQDEPLARMYATTRVLRIADGPDEVHNRTVAQRELRKHADRPGPTVPAPA